mmetsp:Transcript_161/g.592  ORF Transcript_161/g.592 Transcript_161/m.592 type:complete len:182 (+) Transcript_161:54-599(+)
MCAAVVQVTNVVPLDNPSNFTNPFTFEITFESTKDLEEDLEWKLVYVGSAEDSSHDQVLVEVLVGPVASGVSKFVLHGNAPNPELVPARDLVGVTVVVLTCAYRSKEFVRVGYYVNNEMLMNGAVAATTSPGFFFQRRLRRRPHRRPRRRRRRRRPHDGYAPRSPPRGHRPFADREDHPRR